MSSKRKAQLARRQDGEKETGYKKPPKKNQYKPGQSGNPTGKGRGTKNRTTIVRKTLNSKIWIVEEGTRRKISRYEALLRTIADSALKDRSIKFVELFLRLSEQLDAADQRAAAKAARSQFTLIDKSMTVKEAADAYAETLTAIPGLMEPDYDLDD